MIKAFNDWIDHRENPMFFSFGIGALFLLIPPPIFLILQRSGYQHLPWWARSSEIRGLMVFFGAVCLVLAVYCKIMHCKRVKFDPNNTATLPSDLRHSLWNNDNVLTFKSAAEYADSLIPEPATVRRCRDCDTILLPPEFDDAVPMYRCPFCHVDYPESKTRAITQGGLCPSGGLLDENESGVTV
jgi:hypothetical protein